MPLPRPSRRHFLAGLSTLPVAGCGVQQVEGRSAAIGPAETRLAAGPGLRAAIATGATSIPPALTSYWNTSQVNDRYLTASVEESLHAHGMLAGGAARFTLDVHLVSMDTPAVVAEARIGATLRYRLARPDGSLVAEGEAPGLGVVPFTFGRDANQRIRLANELALRDAIRGMLAALIREEARNPAAFAAPAMRP